MARIPERWDGPNQVYFVTVVTKNREPVFADEENCRRLQAAFREVRQHYAFRLVALAILPDHWHGIIRPSPNLVIEKIVGAVKENMLRQIWAIRRRPTFWQPQFLDHRIRNDEDFAHHLEYIRLNPVKHEVVARPEEYQWVFFHPRLLG